MDATISMDFLLNALSGLSLNNRQWLAEHLVKPEELAKARQQKEDAEWMKDFFSTPFDNPTTADEVKRDIRESHFFGERDIKPLHDGE